MRVAAEVVRVRVAAEAVRVTPDLHKPIASPAG